MVTYILIITLLKTKSRRSTRKRESSTPARASVSSPPQSDLRRQFNRHTHLEDPFVYTLPCCSKQPRPEPSCRQSSCRLSNWCIGPPPCTPTTDGQRVGVRHPANARSPEGTVAPCRAVLWDQPGTETSEWPQPSLRHGKIHMTISAWPIWESNRW